MIKKMYKVFYINDEKEIKYAFFEEKEDAMDFITVKENQGVKAALNAWRWQVEIED